jgi:tRNA-Thr(GGU) m(6)t(6)A37 methyltransferase TsaA
MEFTVQPIALVVNSRKETEDDHWSVVVSEIRLAESIPVSALTGINEFSHLEIIYIFHKVDTENILTVEHPRENKNYPAVGIFAQRKKNRPNRIGLTTVELVKVDGKTLTVRNLDAIDGTPIIDIKPVMKEFMPQGNIRQPQWSEDLMKNYWI